MITKPSGTAAHIGSRATADQRLSPYVTALPDARDLIAESERLAGRFNCRRGPPYLPILGCGQRRDPAPLRSAGRCRVPSSSPFLGSGGGSHDRDDLVRQPCASSCVPRARCSTKSVWRQSPGGPAATCGPSARLPAERPLPPRSSGPCKRRRSGRRGLPNPEIASCLFVRVLMRSGLYAASGTVQVLALLWQAGLRGGRRVSSGRRDRRGGCPIARAGRAGPGSCATWPAAPVSASAVPTSGRRPVIASATVGKVARCRSRPVADKTLATPGVGEARRSHPPSMPARRPTPTRTAKPLASAYPTADRSTISRLAPGRSKPRSFSRRAGADVMSSPPRSTAITRPSRSARELAGFLALRERAIRLRALAAGC